VWYLICALSSKKVPQLLSILLAAHSYTAKNIKPETVVKQKSLQKLNDFYRFLSCPCNL
jgi:hypothetical protein